MYLLTSSTAACQAKVSAHQHQADTGTSIVAVGTLMSACMTMMYMYIPTPAVFNMCGTGYGLTF